MMQFRPSPETLPGQFPSPKRRTPRPVAPGASARRAPTRLLLEALEDRTLLSFSPAVSYAAGPYPFAIATADFNHDEVEDLAVANYSGSSVSVLLGNPDGTFQAAQNLPTGANPISVAVGDFDDDGNMDIATANAGSWDASVLMGKGDGTFDPAASLGIGMSPTSVAVGDFNGDNLMDLGVTSNYYTYYGGWYYWYGYYESYANVLLGNGDGSFSAPNSTWMGQGYHNSAAVADFNGDDIDDFASVNSDYWTVSVLLGDSSGFLQWSAELYAGYYPYAVAAGDVDGDEDADIVTANLYGNDVGVLRGDGAGGFAGPESYATGHAPGAVVLGDFTGDGRMDIATANGWDGTVSVLRATSDGGFAAPAITAAGAGAWGIAAADFNGDLWLDIVTANADANNVTVLLNTQEWRSFQVSGYPSSVVVGETHTVTVTALDTNGNVITGYAGTVHFSSSDGLAGLPEDYAFAPADNGAKTFSVTLNTVGTQSIGVNDTATPDFAGQQVGIFVNPPPPATLSIDNVEVTETDSGTIEATFTVTRGGNLDNTVNVNFSTFDGGALAGSDYVETSGALTFGPNELSKEITVLVNGDVTDEYDQSFYVNLWGISVGGAISDGWGECLILDNDAAPTMSITAVVSKNEGKKNALTSFDFIVTLSAPSEKDIWVDYATANGTATTADSDYIAKSSTLFIGAGQTSATITVQVRGDNRKESNETFSVTLSDATNATILSGVGIGEILDDDATPRGKGKS